jgi:septum formation topological specificity factor MinE
MKKMIIIGFNVFEYIGNYEREIIEVRNRERNFINNGEFILANELQSLSFSNNPLFKKRDISKVVFASEKEEEQTPGPLALTEDEIKLIVEKYLNDNNLVAIEKDADANVSNLESKLTPPPPPVDDEVLASILKGLETGELKEEDLSEYDKELLAKERQRVLDKQEPLIDLENISPLEEFETKESLETYGLNFGINLNKTKKLENMYAELLAHIETLKSK